MDSKQVWRWDSPCPGNRAIHAGILPIERNRHPDEAAPRPTDAEVAHTLGITRQQGRRALLGGVGADCALRADLSRRQSVWPFLLIARLESETCPGGGRRDAGPEHTS
jgi:hypothetical protein